MKLFARFAVPDTTFNVAANIDATGLTSLVRVGLHIIYWLGKALITSKKITFLIVWNLITYLALVWCKCSVTLGFQLQLLCVRVC